MEDISQHYLQAQCQSRTSQYANQSFVKELGNPTQAKIVFKKFPVLSKITINATHSRQTITTVYKDEWTEHQLPTACCRNWR